MAPYEDDHEAEDDSETWAALKKQLLDDNELVGEDRIFLGPVRREASGPEVASRLDSLVGHFREIWPAYLKAKPTPDQEAGFYESDVYIGLREPTEHLLRTWFGAFNCLREAEGWFYKAFGPGRDVEFLDQIAGPMDALYGGIEAMRFIGIEWESLEDGILQESLQELHRLARQLEEPDEEKDGEEREALGSQECLRTLRVFVRAVESLETNGRLEEDEEETLRRIFAGWEKGGEFRAEEDSSVAPEPGSSLALIVGARPDQRPNGKGTEAASLFTFKEGGALIPPGKHVALGGDESQYLGNCRRLMQWAESAGLDSAHVADYPLGLYLEAFRNDADREEACRRFYAVIARLETRLDGLAHSLADQAGSVIMTKRFLKQALLRYHREAVRTRDEMERTSRLPRQRHKARPAVRDVVQLLQSPDVLPIEKVFDEAQLTGDRAEVQPLVEASQRALQDLHKGVFGKPRNKSRIAGALRACDETLLKLHTYALSLEKKPKKRKPKQPTKAKFTKEALALAALKDHPDWTDVQIAEAAGCHPKSLYRMKLYPKAKEALKRGRADIPRGSKSKDGTVEAWDEAKEDNS